MPQRFDPKQAENISALTQALLSLRDEAECCAFLQDLCTAQELISFSQRLQVAKLLLAGNTYGDIRRQIPVSSTTITRVNTALQYGTGGYRSVLSRQEETSEREG